MADESTQRPDRRGLRASLFAAVACDACREGCGGDTDRGRSVMQWKPVEGKRKALTAIGVRGIYTLTKGGGAWWLSGIGHDELSMWELGVRGKPFTYQEQARVEAARIDSAKVREPAVGGE